MKKRKKIQKKKMLKMIQKGSIIILLFFSLFNCYNQIDYIEINEIKIQNNLKRNEITLDYLKKNNIACYDNYINNKENVFEIYDTCFEKDSLIITINDKFINSVNVDGKNNGAGCKLIYQDTLGDSIERNINIKFFKSQKQVNFVVPPRVKGVILDSHLKDHYLNLTYSRFTTSEYYNLITCK